MAAVVVLGVHGGGTSLVAGMLNEIGVAMNPNPKGYIRRKKYKTYEDVDFVRLNVTILHTVGANWKKPPPPGRLSSLPERLTERMTGLIGEREAEHTLWGFKDPRTALTAHLYHPHLPDPHYVIVERDIKAIVNSLVTRAHRKSPPSRWLPIVENYYEHIYQFLEQYKPAAVHVSYEALIDGDEEIRRLIEFVGVEASEGIFKRAKKIVKR